MINSGAPTHCNVSTENYRSDTHHEQDRHLHIVQHTPAAVRVSRSQTGPAGVVLLAALHRHAGDLENKTHTWSMLYTHTHTLLKPPSNSLHRTGRMNAGESTGGVLRPGTRD